MLTNSAFESLQTPLQVKNSLQEKLVRGLRHGFIGSQLGVPDGFPFHYRHQFAICPLTIPNSYRHDG